MTAFNAREVNKYVKWWIEIGDNNETNANVYEKS